MTNDIYVKNKLLFKKKKKGELLDLQFKYYFIIFNEILKKKKKLRHKWIRSNIDTLENSYAWLTG